MKGRGLSLKLKINLVLGLLLVSILLCWVSFYTRANNAIEESAENLVTQVSGRVSDLVYTTFLYLEHTAMVLSTSQTVTELLAEEDPLVYYALRDQVVALADSVYQTNGLVDDIVLYDTQGNFCRLRGDLGNTAATRMSYLVPSQTLMQHGIVTLEGDTYLSYTIEVVDQGHCVGYVVFLMETTRLQNIFASYDTSGLLSVDLVADGALLSGETGVYTTAEVIETANTYSLTSIGSSPFSVLVWDDGGLNDQIFEYFVLIGLVITALLLLLMGGSYRLLNRLVFTPMLRLMYNAKEVEQDPSRLLLDMTGQLEFDQLVAQFNHLIGQLEERTQAAFQLERTVHATELERQTAIVASLKKQINAHFTVNTLAVIRGLNRQGETEKVAKLSDGLAHLLRYAYDGDESISCLSEVIILERYATMMQIRYPDRFTADFDVDCDIEEVSMPRMLLQPILENAIVHGFANQTGCHLTLWGEKVHNTLCFTITDDGHGMPVDKLKSLQDTINAVTPTSHNPDGLKQIALANIQKRVVTDYGMGFGLTIESQEGEGTTVTLTLPCG
ncbi:histidine kinase [Bengtsoniella intestinalis]|uniref:sensor histidine kinase n=1 Tax=Bengtsoniella intestinalis TaxID=3073143 RepID=UPI00391F87F2